MKRIDILILDISLIGGIERVTVNLANYFSKNRKYKVNIISFFKTNESIFYSLEDSIQVKYLTYNHFEPLNKPKKIRNYFRMIKYLRQYLRGSEAQTIISMFTNLNILLSIFKNQTRAKIIATEHARYNAHSSVIKYLRKKLYSRLDKVVVLNSDDFKMYKKHVGDNIKLIPNSLTFEPNQHSKLESKIIMAAGRLTDDKGFDYLLKAFSIVHKSYPEWRLVIAGDGELKDYLVKLVMELGLSEVVELRPFEKEIDKLFMSSSVYCLSSRQECFPMVLLEAMSFGLPAIAFDISSGPKDIIRDGQDGFLVPAFDVDVYAEKIIYLIKNAYDREMMGAAARNNIRRYSINKVGEKWDNIINS